MIPTEIGGRAVDDVMVVFHGKGLLDTPNNRLLLEMALVLKEDEINGLAVLELVRFRPPTLFVRLATAHDAKRELMIPIAKTKVLLARQTYAHSSLSIREKLRALRLCS